MGKAIIGRLAINVQAEEGRTWSQSVGQTSEGKLDALTIMEKLCSRISNLEEQVDGLVEKHRILKYIHESEESILIDARKVYAFGEWNFYEWLKDVTGKNAGVLPEDYTRIRGGVIQTGKVMSHDKESWIDLDATGNTAFIKCKDYVSIQADGDFVFGLTAGSNLTLDKDTGRLYLNLVGNNDLEGLVIGNTPKTTGFLMNYKALRGYYNGDLIMIMALESITEGNWTASPGDHGVGNPSTNNYWMWDNSEGEMIIRGSLNADDITAGAINADLITTGAINADLITTGTLIGRTIKSVDATTRIEMNASDHRIYYAESGVTKIQIGALYDSAYIWTSGKIYGGSCQLGGTLTCGSIQLTGSISGGTTISCSSTIDAGTEYLGPGTSSAARIREMAGGYLEFRWAGGCFEVYRNGARIRQLCNDN